MPLVLIAIQMTENLVCLTTDFHASYQPDTCVQQMMKSPYNQQKVATQLINNLAIKTMAPFVISQALIMRYGAILIIQSLKSVQRQTDKTATNMNQAGI